MLWIKSLHIVFVTSWFAGLFYLPRIFVNLAQVAGPGAERDRLLLMARKLYRFMTPLATLAIVFGSGCGEIRHRRRPRLDGGEDRPRAGAGRVPPRCGKLLHDFKLGETRARTSGTAGSTKFRCCCWLRW